LINLRSEQEIMTSWKGDFPDPLVSISCVTYNHEKYIKDALDGFLNQKADFTFEVLVHDDASLDNTADIIRKYEAKYPHIIKPIYQTENQYSKKDGEAGKIHRDRARGKYMALCDGDDYWTDPLKLQKQFDCLEQNPAFSMCFANSTIIDNNGKTTSSSRVPDHYKRTLSQEDILNGFCPPTNTMLVKNDYLKSILQQKSSKIINNDYFFACLMAEYGEIAYIDNIVAAYRKHDKGTWSATSEYDRDISLFHLFDSLSLHITKNKNIVKKKAADVEQKLKKENMEDLFLENHCWTPQTAMLRSIRDLVMKMEGDDPVNSLSVDTNPSLEKILLRKWPRLQIDYAKYPKHDVQNLHNFQDESFDIVFSHQVLEHIPKPWIAAKELVRILKKGGIGIHTSCAFNPRHGYPSFKDYYRFLPDGLAELFDGVDIWLKDGWGSREALIYNLAIDDGHKGLGGRRFTEALGIKNEADYPWHTWVIFQKKLEYSG